MNPNTTSGKARLALHPTLLALCISTSLGLAAPAVLAQTNPATAVTAETQSYRIPAQPLSEALIQFGQQSGLQVTANSTLLEGKQATAVNGSMSAEQALSRLLAGTDLRYQINGGMVSLVEGGGAVMLGPLRVGGDREAMNGTAESGYRSSTVSQVGPWEGRELEELPYSITVLPTELIQNVGGSSPDQLYRINPTTLLTRSQHENSQATVSMRGFTTSRTYTDGLQGSTYGQHASMEDTDRIEVLTGLSGFLYGPGNIGGVINYVSKKPTDERLNRVSLNNNGSDNYQLQGDFGGPIDSDGRFGYRFNAAHQDGETAVDGMEIRTNFVSGVLDWKPTDHLLLRINYADRDFETVGRQSYWWIDGDAQRPSASSIDSSQSWGQPWIEAEYEHSRYGANLRWEPATWLTMRAALQKFKGEESTPTAWNTILADGTFTQTADHIYAPGVNPGFTFQDDESAYLFADIGFNTGTISHKLTAGMQYTAMSQKRFENSAPELTIQTGAQLGNGPVYISRPVVEPIDRGDVVGPVWAWTYTTFTLGDDIRLNEQWSLLAGISWSEFDDPEITILWPRDAYSKSAVTPSLSLIYKPLPWMTTYASYIEALEKGGAAAEQRGGQPVVNAGQVFEPLVSDQIEVGAKFSVGGLLLTTALFEINKSLQYYDLTDPAAPRFVQDGLQMHRGLEFTAVGKATDRLTLIGGFTLLDAQVKEQKQNPALEGKRPTEVADKFFKLRAEYDTPWVAGLTLVGGANYTADRYADNMNTDRLSSYTLYDVGARYRTRVGNLPVTARFEIQNLTDERYWANNWQVGDPRAVTFSLSADF